VVDRHVNERDDVQRVEVVGQMPAATVIKLFVTGTAVVLFVMLSVFSFFVYSEAKVRNDLIYKQCVDGELRDTVIANQSNAIAALLRGIKDPPPTVENLIEVSEDAIHTLEPGNPPGSDERPCFRPNNWWPW